MTDTDQTALQRMFTEEQARELLDDLGDLTAITPEDTEPENVDRWELVVSFDQTDIPTLRDELRELVGDGS